jgi:hypothetical protein
VLGAGTTRGTRGKRGQGRIEGRRSANPVELRGAAPVAGQALTLSVESDRLVIFGDGIEPDAIELGWGQAASVTLAAKTLTVMS